MPTAPEITERCCCRGKANQDKGDTQRAKGSQRGVGGQSSGGRELVSANLLVPIHLPQPLGAGSRLSPELPAPGT